ncbi:MAG: glycosyl transferase [Pseudomonadota bacterium]
MFGREINEDNVQEADLVVGIPSFNEANSIDYPTSQAGMGLTEYFGHLRSVIINCDNDSSDGTRETFLNTPTQVPKIYLSTLPGVKGKGNNFRNLFAKVIQLKAKAVIVVDADLKSITPEWISRLGEPLFLDYSYVAPIYLRHKYDGTITNNIAYPLIRALYGRRIRQPIGGDFGFSADLARIYLDQSVWDDNIANFGIDIWMTNIALVQNLPFCQAYLGTPKVHHPKDPSSQLGSMFGQVLSTLFLLMEKYVDFWTRVRWSKPTPIFGFGLGEVTMPPPVRVNGDRLHMNFIEGHKKYSDLWEGTIDPETLPKLGEIGGLATDKFEIPIDLWARILYDYALAFHLNEIDRTQLLESLGPLYYGQVLSFVNTTKGMSANQAEEYMERLCRVFERTKPYLVNKWLKVS